MPKKVDHEQRRRDLAAALRRVVSRGGVESASIRAVAAEAGWSLGAVQYYFSTRDELLLFAGRQLLADAEARIAGIIGAAEVGRALDERSSALDVALRLCEEALPIDKRHRSEQLLWLALMMRSAREPGLQPSVGISWDAVRSTARMAVAALLRRSDWLEVGGQGLPLPDDVAEATAAELHIVLDGLFLQGLIYPERDPEALRFIISHEVGHLAAGHVSFWRLLVSQAASSVPLLGKALSRAQEYTADNHGYDVSPTGVPGVVGLLGAGKYLGAQVGLHATADRAAHERGFWVHIVQWTSTHPILTWRAHALRDRSRPGRLMMRPKTAWYPPVSPAGGVGSEAWPTPADVLARMDRSAPRVPGAEEQFGRYPGMFYAVGRDELRLSDPTPLFTPPDAAGRPAHPRT